MLDAFSAWFLVFAFISTTLFHVAIVLGAPLGEYSYGGQAAGKLSLRLRATSIFSVIVMLGLAGHCLAQVGVFQPLFDGQFNQIGNWAMVAFCALAAIMNNITKSMKERRLWGPVTLAMLAASLVVAI